ncbi:MAG: hypothetical protein Q7J07_08355 [Pelolinea sp.]|nr:hypothetical protein [Pelolinea sp.]
MSKKSKNKTRSLPVDRKIAVSKNASSTTDFNPDYSYVKKDLKRIGSLAAIFFIILIVLTFVLR